MDMGIFTGRSRKKSAKLQPVVTVAFRDLATGGPLATFSPEHGYAYLWPFPEEPRVGDWAVAPGMDGPASVVVGSLGLPASAQAMTLKPLLKQIPAKEVARVRAEVDAAEHRWLDHARYIVSLPVADPAAAHLPPGFDPLPPTQGTAGSETADEYGRAWWQAYKLAAELGRPSGEIATYKTVGQNWFKIRDLALKEARDKRMAKTAATTDFEAAIRNVRNRSRADVEQMIFAGQPLWDWLTYAQSLEREGRVENALKLLYALISAAEQEAEVSGREPAPAYTERAAIIHRRRRDYAAEILVIERWKTACPPAKRGPGATQPKLLKRLQRARELAQKR